MSYLRSGWLPFDVCIAIVIIGLAGALFLGRAGGEAVQDAVCATSHADCIVQKKAMADCTVDNKCVLTPEAFLEMERAEARTIAECPVEENE